MDYSYQSIYSGYVKFCGVVDVKPLAFEDWMVAREGPPIRPNPAKEFLTSRTADSGSNSEQAVQVI